MFDRLRRLIREIHRRSLWQVLGIYVVASWAVLQVVDTLGGAWNLPEWFPSFAFALLLVGLPVVLATAFVQEGIPGSDDGGAEVAQAPAPTSRLFSWRNAFMGGVGALALWGIIAAGWLALQGGTADPPGALSGQRVAVLPFRVTGAADVGLLGEGMARLLSMNLDGAGRLRAVDPAAVLGAVGSQAGEPGSALDRGVAQSLGAALYVVGELVEIGGRIRARASLQGPDQDSPPVTAEAQGDTTDLFGLVDRLTSALLAERGGAGGSLSSFTTDSVRALKAYLAGEDAFSRLDLPSAVEYQQEAIAIDSTFALAAYRLGVAAAWAHQMDQARAALAMASRHVDNLSDRDRMLLSAFGSFVLEGDAVAAEELYRQLLARYPETVEAHYWLGETQLHFGPLRGRSTALARESFERVLGHREDHAGSILHLLGLSARQSRLVELDSLSAWFLALQPSPEYGLAAHLLRRTIVDSVDLALSDPELQGAQDAPLVIAAGILGQARQVDGVSVLGAALATGVRGPDIRATGYLARAYADLARGRWSDALGRLDQVERLDYATAVLYRGLLAVSPLVDRPASELSVYRDELERWTPTDVGPRVLPGIFLLPPELYPTLRAYVLGLLEARLQLPQEALGRGETLERASLPVYAGTVATDFALSVRSEIARVQGSLNEALDLLEQMDHRAAYELTFTEPVGMAAERIRRGDLLLGAGRYEEALSWYASASDAWQYNVAFLAPGYLGQARALERLGRQDEAASYYRSFVQLWQESDPDLQPLVEAARTALARLEG